VQPGRDSRRRLQRHFVVAHKTSNHGCEQFDVLSRKRLSKWLWY
jgi:hypothetical protein